MPANPLSALDSEEIRAGIVRGDTDVVIGAAIGRHRCTIGREITRNGGRDTYTATAAEARAVACRARPKTSLLADADLGWHVTKRLLAGDSPMTISIEVSRGIHGHTANISHETIYQAIYAPQHVALPTRPTSCCTVAGPGGVDEGNAIASNDPAHSACSTPSTPDLTCV